MATWTYAKLRDDSWGARIAPVPTPAPRAGERVTLEKRSGERKDETLGELVFIAPDGAFALFRIARVAPAARGAGAGGRPTRRGYECDECCDRVIPGSRCWETGMTH